ncbi:MAG: hypothetical protein RL705_994 [Bacteroidota bacterium]
MDKCTIIRLIESGRSQRSVAKELTMNRRTVSRYWKEYLQAKDQISLDPSDPIKKEALTSKPAYKAANRRPRKYTEEIDKRIDELLEFDREKAKKLGPHKQKLTTRSIHEILVSEGFDIGESTIRPYVRKKVQKQKEAFIKQIYPLGYRVEFDFGEVKCLIKGEKRLLYLAVFSSPATGYRWGSLYTSSNQGVFIDAHIQFFKEVQGAYSTVVYDNMRNVVQKFVGKHEKELNEELVKLSLFYGFQPVVTNTYSGNEKGHVEKSVQVIRDRAFTKIYEFSSIDHAQEYLTSALTKLNQGTTIEIERPQLKPLVSDYDYAVTTSQKVDKYSFIHVQTNFYSVPDYLVGEVVTAKLYLNELRVVRNGQVIASHQRLNSRNSYQVKLIHYLYTLKRKPGAVEHSLVLAKLPKLRRCFLQFYKQRPKRFLQLLEAKQDLSIDELVRSLDELATEDQEVFTHQVPTKAVNEARKQLREYNRIHQVKEVNPL